MTPLEVNKDRLAKCLSEAGFPNVKFGGAFLDWPDWPSIILTYDGEDAERAVHKAWLVCGSTGTHTCYDCYMLARTPDEECDHDSDRLSA